LKSRENFPISFGLSRFCESNGTLPAGPIMATAFVVVHGMIY